MFEAAIAYFKKHPAPLAPTPPGEVAWSESSLYGSAQFPKYNPDDLIGRKGFSIYQKMMTDEQIKAVVRFKRDAISSRQSFFTCDHDALSEDENAARIKLSDIIVDKMSGAWGDSYNGILSAMYQGFSLTEKIYAPLEIEGKSWIGIKRLKLRPANTFRFHVDEFGNITKITQHLGSREQEIDITKFIHYVQNPDVDEHYGQSELREAYRAWFSKDMAIRFQNIHLERFAGGFAVAKPIVGKTIQSHSAEATSLQNILSNLNGKTSILLPAGIDLTVINPATTDMFEKAIAQHDKSIAKSLLVPNLMGISEQGTTGSFAQSQTQMEAFLWTLEADSKRLEEVLNEQLWKELGELNWGDGYYPTLRFKPISEARKMDIITKWTSLVTGGAVKASAVDETHIRNLLDFPQLAVDDSTGKSELLLNGAQVTALAAILVQVSSGAMLPEAAKALIMAAFPLSDEQVTVMVQVKEKEPIPAALLTGALSPAAPATQPTTPPSPPKSGAGSNLQDETIAGKSLVTVAAMSRAMKRVDFAVIANKADNSAESYAHDIAVINSAAVARMMREAEELKLGTAEGIPTDVLKIKFNADEQSKMKRAVSDGLKEAWGVGEYHAKKELGKAAFVRMDFYGEGGEGSDGHHGGGGSGKASGSVLYHGTSQAAFDSIVKDGFNASTSGVYGQGVYLTTSIETAEKFSDGKILRVEIPAGGRIHAFEDDGYDAMLQLPSVRAAAVELRAKDPSLRRSTAESKALTNHLQAKGFIGFSVTTEVVGERYYVIPDVTNIGRVDDNAAMKVPRYLYFAKVPKKFTRTFATNDLALQDAAASYMKVKAFTITGDISAATEKRIRLTLAEGVKVSHTWDETRRAIYKDLEGDGLLTEEAVSEALGTTTVKSTNARINTIMRTATFEAINEARYEFFSDPALEGFVEALEYSAILDERTTEICAELGNDPDTGAGRTYAVDDPIWQSFRPPNHFNCRSLLIPVTQNDTWTRSDDPDVDPQKGFGFHRDDCGHAHHAAHAPAPIFNITLPPAAAQTFNIAVPTAPAPTVHFTAGSLEFAVPVPTVTVNNIVQPTAITLEATLPELTVIAHLPARETTTRVSRNSKGEIDGSFSTEKDAK